MDGCLDESNKARASGAWVGAIGGKELSGKRAHRYAHVTFPDHHRDAPTPNSFGHQSLTLEI